MGGRSVPSSVAEPLFAVRCVAPHHARRVVNPAVSAGVFRQVSQGRAIRGLLLEGLLELQRAYSRGHLITLYVNPGEWPTLGLGGIQRTYSAFSCRASTEHTFSHTVVPTCTPISPPRLHPARHPPQTSSTPRHRFPAAKPTHHPALAIFRLKLTAEAERPAATEPEGVAGIATSTDHCGKALHSK
eukprot:1987290-Pyramimonas_sp.AAC.1